MGEGEWNACKNGSLKRRILRKLHIGLDDETLEVRAVAVTSSCIGDEPMLTVLLDEIPEDQDNGSVTADGAYDTRKCYEEIATHNTYVVISPRKNANRLEAIQRTLNTVNASQCLGRAT